MRNISLEVLAGVFLMENSADVFTKERKTKPE